MKSIALAALSIGLSLLYSPLASATAVHQLPRNTVVSFKADIEMPAQQELILLHEGSSESGDAREQVGACQLHVTQSDQTRGLKAGEGFVIRSSGWIKESIAPGHEVTTAFLRLLRADQPGLELELRLRDTGNLDGLSNFDADLWMQRCRVSFNAT